MHIFLWDTQGISITNQYDIYSSLNLDIPLVFGGKLTNVILINFSVRK